MLAISVSIPNLMVAWHCAVLIVATLYMSNKHEWSHMAYSLRCYWKMQNRNLNDQTA